MNIPYKIYFEQPQLAVKQALPHWHKLALANARLQIHRTFSAAEWCSQVLGAGPFYLELFEVEVGSDFTFSYEVFADQHFLFFMLEGEAVFTDAHGYYISKAKGNQMAFVSNRIGVYKCKLDSGKYTAFCIGFEREWLDLFAAGQDVIENYLLHYSEMENPMLPYCILTKQQAQWLKRLYGELQKSPGPLDGQLRYYISLIFDQYAFLVKAKLHEPVWQLRNYLDQHYSSLDLSLQSQANRLGVRLDRLRYQFKAEFGLSPHQYYTQKRIAKVQFLLSNSKWPLNKIYPQVGYSDESALRYEMKRFGLIR